MTNNEPLHTLGVKTTADSLGEGRLKVGMGRRKKRRVLNKVLDGVGTGNRRAGNPRTDAERRIRHKKLYGTLDDFPKKRRFANQI